MLDRPNATRKTVAAALPTIKDRYRLTLLQVVDSAEGFRVHAELNPKNDSKEKADSKSWKLAPGGFTAHEGQQFIGPDGAPMTNRRGQPIMVHTILRHVTIPPADVAGRVQRGIDIATGFLSAAAMAEAVNDCLENRATEITEAFNRGGKPARTGTSHTAVHRGNKLIGYGYSVTFRQSQANKPERGFRRVAAEVAESALTGVTVHLRVTDSETRQFMVETAYPTPKG